MGRELLPFEPIKHRLAQVLSAVYKDQATAVTRQLVSVAGKRTGKQRVLRSVDGLGKMFRNTYSDQQTDRRVIPILKHATLIAADPTGNRAYLNRSSDVNDAVLGFEETVRHYADNYVSRVVVPRIKKAVANADPDEVQAVVKREMQRAFQEADTYWKNVANVAVSRSFHYGLLKASEDVNMKQVMFMAILDEVTTEFCRKIDGVVVPSSAIIKKMEEVAGLVGKNTERYAPWDFINNPMKVTPKVLIRKGLLIPPFHGHCRTTMHTF